jgi:hypothetical protein
MASVPPGETPNWPRPLVSLGFMETMSCTVCGCWEKAAATEIRGSATSFVDRILVTSGKKSMPDKLPRPDESLVTERRCLLFVGSGLSAISDQLGWIPVVPIAEG